MRHLRKSLLAAPLVATIFAFVPLSQTARASEPAGAVQSTSSATAIGDLVAKIRCLALLYIGNNSVDAMNQANQDGEAAIGAADAEAYNDAFNDFVSAHGTYTQARNSYSESGCGAITGSFPRAPDPIF